MSVLARQVSEARKVAEKRLYATVAKAARRADPALPRDLVAKLKTPECRLYSELERLRRPPTRTTGTAFARALERVYEIGAFQLGRLRLSQIPPNRLAALARYALGSKAPLLERTTKPKRTAMLTAVMRHLEARQRPGEAERRRARPAACVRAHQAGRRIVGRTTHRHRSSIESDPPDAPTHILTVKQHRDRNVKRQVGPDTAERARRRTCAARA